MSEPTDASAQGDAGREPQTTGALIRTSAQRWPEADFVVVATDRLTFAQLDARSRSLAARLVRAGVTKGTHVAVCMPNGPTWVTVWAAATRLGAVIVPVSTFSTWSELTRQLRHADVSVFVTVPSFANNNYLDSLETAVPALAGATEPDLMIAELPHLRTVLTTTDHRGWTRPLDDGQADDPALLAVVDALEAEVTPSDPMLLMYTSGSTAEPKGVVHTQGSLVRHARRLADFSALAPSDRIWTPMPFFWIGGFHTVMMRALAAGAAVVTQDFVDYAEVLRLLSRERVTVMVAWPAASKSLVDQPAFATTDLSSIRAGFWEAMPADRRPADPSLLPKALGMTETCGPYSFIRAGFDETGYPAEHVGAFGKLVTDVELRVVDVDTGEVLGDGEEGELQVRGDSVTVGLHKRERRDVFDADGWYHTGDLGYVEGDWVYFVGRAGDMIKSNGMNVTPAEVEAALAGDPGVKQVFVLGIPHPTRGQDVAAVVVPWSGDDAEILDLDRLKARAREHLSAFKRPRHLMALAESEIPWLASQKVNRRRLTELVAERIGEADHH